MWKKCFLDESPALALMLLFCTVNIFIPMVPDTFSPSPVDLFLTGDSFLSLPSSPRRALLRTGLAVATARNFGSFKTESMLGRWNDSRATHGMVYFGWVSYTSYGFSSLYMIWINDGRWNEMTSKDELNTGMKMICRG